MRFFHSYFGLVLAVAACSPEVGRVPAPPPLLVGSRSVSFDTEAIRAGTTELRFGVFEYQGAQRTTLVEPPPAVEVRALGVPDGTAAWRPARTLSPRVALFRPDGSTLEANLVASLEVPAVSSVVLEFRLLAEDRKMRTIQAPAVVHPRVGTATPGGA